MKKPVPNVNVSANGTTTQTGRIPLINRWGYSLALESGMYDITFEAEGYQTHIEQDVEIIPGVDVNLDVELLPEK